MTEILQQGSTGRPEATRELFDAVYEQLRQLAAVRMASERLNHTLTATALVNEVYLRLVDEDSREHWQSRAHFFCAASEAMRRILIDSVRRRMAAKRGGGEKRVALIGVDVPWSDHHEQMLAVNEVLDEFADEYPRQAQLFKLRCFSGLTSREAADLLQISLRTAANDWAFAKAWLGQRIAE